MSTNAKSFALVGAGAVASAIAPAWISSGAVLRGIVARRRASAERLAERCGAPREIASASIAELSRESDLVLLAVPDAAIESVALELARCGHARAGRLFAHASGALSARILAPLAERGALVASLHPLIALPPQHESQVDWSEVHFGIEAEGAASDRARAWVERLGARAFRVTAEAKALYHAAAVLASNDLVALLAEAQRCLALAAPEAAPDALLALAASALGALRAEQGDAARALSGPLVRGDAATVRAHLAAFERIGEEKRGDASRLRALYVALLRSALPLARVARGDAGTKDGALDALERSLEEPPA